MAAPQSRLKVPDYARLLRRRGEVEIGRRARHLWWRNLLIGLVGVFLLVAAGWLYRSLRATEEVGIGRGTYPVKVSCVNDECGFAGVLQVRPAARFPLACPRCGQKSCWQVWRCLVCGREFVPRAVGGPVQCPHEGCRSLAVGSAVPDDRVSEPEGSP